MGVIYDHRPKTRGAGPGMSSWMGAGIGAARGKQMAEERAEAVRREEAFKKDQRIRDIQIETAEQAAAMEKATQVAQREALGAGGNQYDDTVRRLDPKQKAVLDRMLAEESNVDPDFIAKQLDEWGQEFALQDAMDGMEDLERYGASIGTDPQTGEAGPAADTVEQILKAVRSGQMPLQTGLMQLKEIERGMQVERIAAEQQMGAMQAADEMVANAETRFTPDHPNYERIVDILTDIRSNVTTVRHPDKAKGMVPKDYKALLARLEYYVNPSLKAAAQADMQERAETQEGMQQANPIVYTMLQQVEGDEIEPAVFQDAVQAYELGGVDGLRRHLNLPPPPDPERAIEREQTASEGEQTAGEGEQTASDPYTIEGFEFSDGGSQDDPQSFKSQTDKPKPKSQTERKTAPLASLNDAEKKEAMTNLKYWLGKITPEELEGMSEAEYRARVEKEAREVGIDATFDEIMENMTRAGEPEKAEGGKRTLQVY